MVLCHQYYNLTKETKIVPNSRKELAWIIGVLSQNIQTKHD